MAWPGTRATIATGGNMGLGLRGGPTSVTSLISSTLPTLTMWKKYIPWSRSSNLVDEEGIFQANVELATKAMGIVGSNESIQATTMPGGIVIFTGGHHQNHNYHHMMIWSKRGTSVHTVDPWAPDVITIVLEIIMRAVLLEIGVSGVATLHYQQVPEALQLDEVKAHIFSRNRFDYE